MVEPENKNIEKRIDKFKLDLNKELGRGSYGAVYKTTKVGDYSFYASKIMNKSNFANSLKLFEQMILNQVSILKNLQHPNMVIKDYLEKKKIIDEEEAIEFIKQLVKGMDYCISKNIIHSDIKPANILIHSSKKYQSGKLLKICDFGFGRFLQDINQQNSMTLKVVSPYLAPEIYDEEVYNYKCDIWSLGIIFYEMLHGHTPWNGRTQKDLFNYNIKMKPLIFDKHIRQDLKKLISRMLQIQQNDRISIDELKAEIEKL